MAIDLSADPYASFGFTQTDCQRIQSTVRYVETIQRSRPPQRAKGPVGGGASIIGIYPALAGGSGIPARSTAANGFQQAGSATVTLLKQDSSDYLYVSVQSTTLSSGGSGYTDGTGYTLGVSGGNVMSGKDAQGTFDVVSGAVTNIKITDGGEYKPAGTAPTISFSGAGGGSGATATAAIGQTVTCKMTFGTAVGNNHYLMVALCSDGKYRVLSEDCP